MSERLRIITRQEIAQYAQAVENGCPIFLNREDANAAGFDRVIAPTGYLGQYRMFCSEERVPQGGVHTKHKMTFKGLIKEGDYLTAKTITSRSKDSKGRELLVYTTTFSNQDNQVVCIGEMTNLMAVKG